MFPAPFRIICLTMAAGVASTAFAPPQRDLERFLPMAVWYGGGKARAPMVEADARSKKELWRKDVRAIKATGFNTVRAWTD